MPKIINKKYWKTKYSLFSIICVFFVIIINYLVFKEFSVNPIFLIPNFIVVILFFALLKIFSLKLSYYSEKRFLMNILLISLFIRIVVMLFLYILFYNITGTSFDVEATDSLTYHNIGLVLANQLRQVKFDLHAMPYNLEFGDLGYSIFLAIIYYLFDNSIIVVRFIQCLIDSFSVILIYKITNFFWNTKIARFASILSMIFLPQIFYVSVHQKETVMIFLVLLSIYYSIKLLYEKISISKLFILLFSIVVLLSMRTSLVLVLIFSILGYYVFNRKKPFYCRVALLLLLTISLYMCMNFLNIYKEFESKTKKYIGIESNGSRGGRSVSNLLSGGQSFVVYASTPILLIQSISTPYPSMVKTNIKFYNQTLQWYHIGGLFIWVHISFFCFMGLYHAIKHKLKDNSILIFYIFGYTIALVSSLYIMSIRYNILKLVPLLIFVAIGFYHTPKNKFKYWYIYVIFISIVILAWNFVKLAGRELIHF